jgi:iron complex outermembrane receptor protein
VAGCVEAAVNGTCGTIDNPIIGLDGHPTSGDWSDFSGKVSLRYALSDASSLYFLYSEGFKSGGFQFNALNAEQLSVVYDSETSQNVEIGWKTGTDRWIGAVTLFALAIDDQQFPNFVPVQGGNFVSVTTNLGGMESTGLELEGTWLVTDSFLLGGNLAVIDSEIVDSVVISGFDSLGNPSFVDASGIVPWGVPEETGTLYGEYTFGLGNGSEITLRADYWHRGEAWFGNTDRTNPDLRRPEIDQVGARVTWTSATEQTRVALWGSNLGDEIDQLSWGAGFQTLQTPKIIGGKKEYGVTVSHRF